RPGGREGGVAPDTLGTLSEKVSRRLDLEDVGSGRYQLEVSTPGIERPLKTPAQFRRFVGERGRGETAEPVEGAHVHEGVLAEADDGAIVVDIDGARRRIP